MLATQTEFRSCGQILLIGAMEIDANPHQPRKCFDIDELAGLADSIRHNGIIQPISVRRKSDGRFELISGERRLRAAKIAGLRNVPCILIEASDEKSAVYALIENLQRQDLNFFEEAQAIASLHYDHAMSQDELSRRIGKAQSTLSNKMRLLRLPSDIKNTIISEGLTERHARALLRLPSESYMRRALEIIISKRMNVSETDKFITRLLEGEEPKRKPPKKLFKDVRLFVNTLNHAVDTMRKAGIDADSEKSETPEYIEYVVRIPKQQRTASAELTHR